MWRFICRRNCGCAFRCRSFESSENKAARFSQPLVNNCLPPARDFGITARFMVGKVAVGISVFGVAAIATSYAQQVEIAREKPAAKIEQQTKTPSAQRQIELRPQAIPVSYTTTSSSPPVTIEQMRKAGALAVQRVRVEM